MVTFRHIFVYKYSRHHTIADTRDHNDGQSELLN